MSATAPLRRKSMLRRCLPVRIDPAPMAAAALTKEKENSNESDCSNARQT